MPSTYSNIKIQLMATGENNTTWGNVTNINLGTALEEAIVGSADVTFASGNVTLTLTDTNASQTARHVRLRCTGVTGGSTRDLIVPAIEKPYLVQNDCLNSIVVKNATGTGITVPAGKTMWVYNDGTNVVDAVNHLSSLTLGTALPVGQGGTGASTFTANGIIYGNTTSALLATAAGTTGQVLVGNTGGAPSWATLTGIGVTSFSGGTTGLTPASPTTGAITLAGTLGVANGGTGTATAFTAGSVVFAGASGVYSQDNTNLFWDNANDRLGIGTATPTGKLDVIGSAYIGSNSNNSFFIDSDASLVTVGAAGRTAFSTSALRFLTSDGSAALERMRITSGGNVGIGTTSPANRLQVSYTSTAPSLSSDAGSGLSLVGSSTLRVNIGSDPSFPFGGWIQASNGSGSFFPLNLNPLGGNVGIGTAAPTTKLTIADNTGTSGLESSFGITNTVDSNFFIYVSGTANADKKVVLGPSTATSIVFSTNSAECMRITSAGSVGIGTTAPISKFEVTAGYITSGTVSSTGGAKILAGQWSGTEHLTTFGSEYSSGGPALGYAVWPSTTTFASFVSATSVSQPRTAYTLSGGSHIWYTGGTQTVAVGSPVVMAETMRIDGAGNVGIGTSSPSQLLTVSRNSASSIAALVEQLDGTGASSARFRATHGSGTIGTFEVGSGFATLSTSSAAPLVFATDSTERMRITAAGVVGINTSNPASGLDVNSIAIWCGTKTASSGSGGNVRFRDDTGTFRYANGILGSPAETSYSIYDNVAANSRLTITSTGNVGIGTITPNNLLQSSYGVSASVPAAGTGGHGLAVGSSGYGLAAGALTSGSGYLQVTRWDGTATNYNLILQPNGGDVGIGTTTPSYPLEVRRDGASSFNYIGSLNTTATGAFGAGFLARAGSGFAYFYMRGDGLAYVENATANPLGFATNGTEKMRITSAGDVGIGTSSPAQKFVVSDAGANGFEFDASTGILQTYNRGTSAYTDMRLYSLNHRIFTGSSPTEKARIDSSGNLLVGTTTANGILSVVGNQISVGSAGGSGSLGIQIKGTTLNAIPAAQVQGYIATGDSTMGIAGDLIIAPRTDAGCAIRFVTGTTPAERMRIESDGNIGIGTATPGVALDVAGVIRSNAWMYITPNTGTDNALYRANNTGGTIYMGLDNSAGGLSGAAYALSLYHSGAYPIVFSTNATERMRITSSGSLLVGTTSLISSAKVSIDSGAGPSIGSKVNATTALGHIIFENPNGVVGQIYTNGSATVYDTSSDARLKENVTDADDAAALIDAIQVRKFDWKVDGQHQRYGFVAQELLPVAPEAVSVPADPDNMMGVDYSKLVPMLVKEIQSLRARVAQLEGK